MGSRGEKKSGLVGEKSHMVHSVNWKLDAMLKKELGMLDTSKRRVEHRIAMDQVVAKKRFQVKLHRSKVFHARMKGDTEMLRKLITKDNYDFHTNATSVDVLNKRREKDLAKKRVLHRQSQDKMMTLRTPTPAATKPTIEIPDLPGDNGSQRPKTRAGLEGTQDAVSLVRPMTAIERISSAKYLAARAAKQRPVTALINRTKLNFKTDKYSPATQPVPEITSNATTMKMIPEKSGKVGPERVTIKITSIDENTNDADKESDPNVNQNVHEKASDEKGATTNSATRDSDEIDHKDNVENGNSNGTSTKSEENSKETLTIGVPKKSILRPRTAPGKSQRVSTSGSSSSEGKTRPRTSVCISEPVTVNAEATESPAVLKSDDCASVPRPKTGGKKSKSKSPKSKRKQSLVSIFSEEKKLTIMDIDEGRRERANQDTRIKGFVSTLDDVKTDPDLIVDYYMARLLEDSSISGGQKNVQRIRDMPDSDYDKDLAKRSLGDLNKNTVTFRDVNRNYSEYKHDPYTPLHPTSMGFNLTSRNSSLGGVARHESRITQPTTAWQAVDSDSD
ncbi:uncharacterized protein [Diadema antillarum]|uniref:uncharacterized protein n=1 Tax=Diadema antillarum TaxID=105358 RepID=UPI003A8955D5